MTLPIQSGTSATNIAQLTVAPAAGGPFNGKLAAMYWELVTVLVLGTRSYVGTRPTVPAGRSHPGWGCVAKREVMTAPVRMAVLE